MASKRNLKKDIDFLTIDVISDCYAYLHIFPQKNTQKIIELIEDVQLTRSVLIQKVNNPVGNTKKEIKAHYNSIVKELMDKTSKSFDKIIELQK